MKRAWVVSSKLLSFMNGCHFHMGWDFGLELLFDFKAHGLRTLGLQMCLRVFNAKIKITWINWFRFMRRGFHSVQFHLRSSEIGKLFACVRDGSTFLAFTLLGIAQVNDWFASSGCATEWFYKWLYLVIRMANVCFTSLAQKLISLIAPLEWICGANGFLCTAQLPHIDPLSRL